MTAPDETPVHLREVADLLRSVRKQNTMAPTEVVATRQAEVLDDADLLVTEGWLRAAFHAGCAAGDPAGGAFYADEAFEAWLGREVAP